jgi:two-component system, sensor histidine kinase PdtaS
MRPILILSFLIAGFASAQIDSAGAYQLLAGAWKMRSTQLDSAIAITGKVLKRVESAEAAQGWHDGARAKSNYYLGNFYGHKGQNETAMRHFSIALAIAGAAGDVHNISLVNGGLGVYHLNRGNYHQALEYLLKALAIDEKRGYREGVAVRLSNIGTVYDSQGEGDKAIGYYTRAMRMFDELRDSAHISIALSNVGIVYFERGDKSRALNYFMRSTAIDRAQKNTEGISRNLNNLGSIYQDRGEYKKALAAFTEGLKLAEELGATELVISHTGNLGALANSMGNQPQAESLLKKAIAMAEEAQMMDAIADFEKSLSGVYEKQGNHDLALKHHKKHIVARDTVFNQQNTEKSVRLEMNYEFEKERELQKARHDEQLHLLKAENRRQKQFWVFSLVVAGLTLVLLVMLKRAYDNKKRLAEFLAAEGDYKEALLQEVNHRVNNNFQIISSLLTLQGSGNADEQLKTVLAENQGRIQSLSTLHELLYTQNGGVDVNMRDYIDKVLGFHRQVTAAKGSKVEIRTSVTPVAFPSRVAVPVALIVNELVTNSLKYAFAEDQAGLIEVILEETAGKRWQLSVRDNGRGIPDEGGRPGSMGLRLVKMMARKLKADVSQVHVRGSAFNFIFAAPELSLMEAV